MSWSYQQLDPVTAELFRLLGLHAGPDVSAAAAASLARLPVQEARRGLGDLARAHLLTEHAPGRFSSHDLLRAYAAELTESAESEAERRAATGRMLDHYLRTAHRAALQLHPTRRRITLAPPEPGAEPEHVNDAAAAQAWFHAELRVLMAAAERALEAGFDAQAWQIAWALFRYLETGGRWHDWVKIEQCALAATERLGDPSAHALAHQRFGYASGRLARYDEAYAHLDRALSIHTELGDHAGQAYVHNSLAIMLDSQGRTSEALQQAKQALDSYTAAGHANGRAVALNAVGWFHAMLGNHQEALSYAGQSLDLSREIGSEDGMAAALDTLGYAHQHLGHPAEAVSCYQQALDLHLEVSGNWGAAETLGHLGDARHAAGDLAGARADWEQSLAVLDDLDHPDADRIRAKLSGL
jgi:tetratricopeptide (TPR) repeat protein